MGSSTNQGDQVLLLQDGNTVFETRLPKTEGPDALQKGSQLEVTGVAKIEVDDNGVPNMFRLLLRSADDVKVLQMPSWWSLQRTVALVSLLILVSVGALAWGALEAPGTFDDRSDSRDTRVHRRRHVSDRQHGDSRHVQPQVFGNVEVPEGALVSENVSHFLRIALGQLGDPRKFLAQIMKGFASSTSSGHDVVELKEGRVFERHSEPGFWPARTSGGCRTCGSPNENCESRRPRCGQRKKRRRQRTFQERIFDDHEPRNSHSDEWNPRNDRSAAGHGIEPGPKGWVDECGWKARRGWVAHSTSRAN
jgi:hypothetical protein